MLYVAGGTLSIPTSANLPKYGPTGQYKPDNTPDYSTPADVYVNSWTQLRAAINTIQSGQVIEVTVDLPAGSDNTDISTNRMVNFANNVLIRPTLGQRFQLDGFNWSVDHVVLAGFNLIGTYYRLGGCTQAHLWRCVDVTGKARFSLQSADRSSLTEVICPTRAISVDVGDRIDITTATTTQNAYFTTVQGCYILSSWSGVAQYAPFIIPLTHITSQLYSGMVVADVTVNGNYDLGAIFMQIPNYLITDNNSDYIDVQVLLNGTQVNDQDAFSSQLPSATTNGTINFLNSYRCTYPTTALSAGDRLQVVLANVPSSLQNQDLYLQVGDANYQHNDTIQFIRSNHSGGYPFSVRLLNNVLDSTENSIVQNGAGGYGDQDCGDFYIAGNLLCQSGQHGIGIGTGAYSGAPILPVRTHLVNNLVYCNFGSTDVAPATLYGNRAYRADPWSGTEYPIDNTNTFGDTSLPRRPIQLLQRPDMTLLWPECPINTNTLPLYCTPAGYM